MNSRPKWLIPVAVVVGVLLLIGMLIISPYNSLVDKETRVDQTFADLDVSLQQRSDLIPGIISTAQAALDQEREIFGELARARANYAGANSTEEKLEAGGEVESALGRLLVIVENYPTLQSNQTLQDVMVQLEGTENRVGQARRQFNEATTAFNRSVRRFPSSIIAGLFGFDKKPLFVVEDVEDRDAPEVEFNTDESTTTTGG